MNNMKRMRGRNHRHGGGGGGGGGGYRQRGHQPMNRNHVFDSNGPDMRLRGTAQQLFEKYLQLGRDATGSGDRVTAEGYFQHAEHYFRILNAMNQAQSGGQPQHQRRFQPPAEPTDGADGMGEQPSEQHAGGNGAQQGQGAPAHAAPNGNGHQPTGRQANGHALEQDTEGEGPSAESREPA
jgi:hypothetical protein